MAQKPKHVVAVIEARMTSTRLPGKGLLPCLGKPMIERMIERVRRVPSINCIVLATTINATDDPLVELALRLGISFYRGSELDVVGRVAGAMEEAKADVIVRLTGDCPLVDPELVEQHISVFLENDFDYVTNTLVRSFPDGLDVQVTSMSAFRASLDLCRTPQDREYVLNTISQNPDKFRHFNIVAPAELHFPDWRWTLDTEADYRFICQVYESLYPTNPAFSAFDIARLVTDRPDLLKPAG